MVTPHIPPHKIWYEQFFLQLQSLWKGWCHAMKRLLGFILFWLGIGMAIMLFITNGFLAIIIIILCLVIGYNLFTSC